MTDNNYTSQQHISTLAPSHTITQNKLQPNNNSTQCILCSNNDELIIVYNNTIQYIQYQYYNHNDIVYNNNILYNIKDKRKTQQQQYDATRSINYITETSIFSNNVLHTILQCIYSPATVSKYINISLICILTSYYYVYILQPCTTLNKIELLFDLTNYTTIDNTNTLNSNTCIDWLSYIVHIHNIQYTYIAIGNKSSTINIYQLQCPITKNSSNTIKHIISYNINNNDNNHDNNHNNNIHINKICFSKYTSNVYIVNDPNSDNVNTITIARITISCSDSYIRIYDMLYTYNNTQQQYHLHLIHTIKLNSIYETVSNMIWHNNNLLLYSLRNILYIVNVKYVNNITTIHTTLHTNNITYIDIFNNNVTQQTTILTSFIDGSIICSVYDSDNNSIHVQCICDANSKQTKQNQTQTIGQYGFALSSDKLNIYTLYRPNDVLKQSNTVKPIHVTSLLCTSTLTLLYDVYNTIHTTQYTSERYDIRHDEYSSLLLNKHDQQSSTSPHKRKRLTSKTENVDNNHNKQPDDNNYNDEISITNSRTINRRIGDMRVRQAKQTMQNILYDKQYYKQYIYNNETFDFHNQRVTYQTQVLNTIHKILSNNTTNNDAVYNKLTIQQCILLSCYYVPLLSSQQQQQNSSNIDKNDTTAVTISTKQTNNDNIHFKAAYSSATTKLHSNNYISESVINTVTWSNYQRPVYVEYIQLADVLIDNILLSINSYVTQQQQHNNADDNNNIFDLHYAYILCSIVCELRAPYVSLNDIQYKQVSRIQSVIQLYITTLYIQQCLTNVLSLSAGNNNNENSNKLTCVLMCDYILQYNITHTHTLLQLIKRIYELYDCSAELNIVNELLHKTDYHKQQIDILLQHNIHTDITIDYNITQQITQRQQCNICNTTVSITSLINERCNNNHKLLRDMYTLQLITTSYKQLYQCTNCNAKCFMNNDNDTTNNFKHNKCIFDNCYLYKV